MPESSLGVSDGSRWATPSNLSTKQDTTDAPSRLSGNTTIPIWGVYVLPPASDRQQPRAYPCQIGQSPHAGMRRPPDVNPLAKCVHYEWLIRP